LPFKCDLQRYIEDGPLFELLQSTKKKKFEEMNVLSRDGKYELLSRWGAAG
jgi:hypothetical protein